MTWRDDAVLLVGLSMSAIMWDWRPIWYAALFVVLTQWFDRVERSMRVKPPRRIARRGW